MQNFGLYKYRWLLQELVQRDLKIKYRRSVLGYLWSVLNPLLMMTVMTIVFSNMFRFAIPNYPVYLLTGQLIFSFYSEATNFSMSSILGGASLIKKVYLPKYIFPVSRILSSFTNMTFSLAALLIVMLVTGSEFHMTALFVPVVFIYLLMFTIGVGLLLSALVVFFRDIQHLYGVMVTAVMYLTPIFYPLDALPPWLKKYIFLNPLCNYVVMFRKLMINGEWPTLTEHAICFGFAALFLALGIYVFKKSENDFILYI